MPKQPIQKTAAQLAAEYKAVHAWLKYVQPRDFPGYLNDEYNKNIMFDYIFESLDGWVTVENLTAAADANRLRLRGLGIAYVEAKAAREKADAEKKEAERLQKVTESNQGVIAQWLKNECPLGLIVNGDLYGTTQDKMVALIRRNYSGQEIITPAMLNTAVTTLGEALDWFDRSADAMQLRNQPAPLPRKLSEQAQIDAGIKPLRLKGHEADKPMVSMQEAAQKARELFEKQHGLPSEEQLYKSKAEALSVTNRRGKFDHVKTLELRQIFARNNANGSVNWKVTFALRNKAADKIEKEKNR